jgi:hypothetical protein
VLAYLSLTFAATSAQTPQVQRDWAAPWQLNDAVNVWVLLDYEDGLVHNAQPPGYPNRVPPTVRSEAGNRFLTLTASPSDCGPAFATTCPRIRTNVAVGHAPQTTNTTVRYQWRMRIPWANNPAGQDNMWMQLFQDADWEWVGGRTVWIGGAGGHLFLRNQHTALGRTFTQVDLGPIPYDQWVEYSLYVFLTVDPSRGHITLYMDGVEVGSIVGEWTQLIASKVTEMNLQIVDFYGTTGTADYDDVSVSDLGSPGPSNSPCQDRYGRQDGFQLCWETATECGFEAVKDYGQSCDDVCRAGGGQCLTIYGNNSRTPCVAGDEVPGGCARTGFYDDICVCSR